jgi:tetratricopeptide (TPR) repeat protein
LAPFSVVRPLVGACALLLSGCVGEAEHLQAKGNLLLRQGSVAGALQCFRAAAQREDDATNLLRLGNALFRAQRFSEAEAAYTRARARAPEPCEAERPLAQLLAQMGRVNEAENALFACLTRRPGDVDARQALGLMRLDRGDLASAAAAFDDILARNGHHAAALYARGRVALHQGQLGQAETYFTRLERYHPRKPYGSYGRALVATRRRHFTDACASLVKASALGLGTGGWDQLRRDRQLAAAHALPCLAPSPGGAG